MKKSEWVELASYLWFLKKMKQGKYEHIEELIKLVNANIFTTGIEEVKVKKNDYEPPSETLRNSAEKNISTASSTNSSSLQF